MNETATMPGSFKLERDYMTGFAIDPQLGDGVAPQQLTTTTDQFNMSAPAYDFSFDLAMGSLPALDRQNAATDTPPSPLNTNPSAESSAEPTEPSRQSRASSDSSANSAPKKAPKARSAKKSASASAAAKDDKTQRSQSLKRNRIAASKCREKKKVWQHNLEEQKTELEAQHARLQREYNELLSEASIMKNHLMAHAGCADGRIDRWIETEAVRFVGRARGRTPSAGSVDMGLRNDSLMQASPIMPTGLPSPPEPQMKLESINYDHMPDDMFFQEAM